MDKFVSTQWECRYGHGWSGSAGGYPSEFQARRIGSNLCRLLSTLLVVHVKQVSAIYDYAPYLRSPHRSIFVSGRFDPSKGPGELWITRYLDSVAALCLIGNLCSFSIFLSRHDTRNANDSIHDNTTHNHAGVLWTVRLSWLHTGNNRTGWLWCSAQSTLYHHPIEDADEI